MPEYKDEYTADYQAKHQALVSTFISKNIPCIFFRYFSGIYSVSKCEVVVRNGLYVSLGNLLVPLQSTGTFLLNQSLVLVFVNEQMAKAAEHEEDSKKKIVALDKEITRVQEQKVIFYQGKHNLFRFIGRTWFAIYLRSLFL